MPRRISYAQNGEDVRIWHAFGPGEQALERPLTYVEVGANDPHYLSPTAALYDLGWRGLLVEADPVLAERLRAARPGDSVIEAAATAESGEVVFYRVPGTGLGTLDPAEAEQAQGRGFEVRQTRVPARTLNEIFAEYEARRGSLQIHVMIIDVEGAETQVLAGLDLTRYRPMVMCIEAVGPGSATPTHHAWEHVLTETGYRHVAFDGINRWYVANEVVDVPVTVQAGAPLGTTIAEAISTPMNVLDSGEHGWITEPFANLELRDRRAYSRAAWQRELIRHDMESRVPITEYERQITELRNALVAVEGSRSLAIGRKISRVGKKGLHVAQRIRSALPQSLNDRIIHERHLRHVSANMEHLTDAAYLGRPPQDEVSWIADSNPESNSFAIRPPLPPGLHLHELSEPEAVTRWLEENVFDSDEQLDARMDNHNDEVGRVRAALRTRLRIAASPANPLWAGGNRIAIDARSLQSSAFGARGIGRFAKAVLMGARDAVGDDRITLIIDRGLNALPSHLAGECKQVTGITESEVAQFSVFLEPSPMTHSADPLIPLLHSQAHTVAVVFDFIPLHYPSVYLRHACTRAEYAANLDALKLYKDFICISHVARKDLAQVLGRPVNGPHALRSVVAWPRDVSDHPAKKEHHTTTSFTGPIVLMTGDEPRKNTFGGLAGIAAATSSESQRDVVVVGMAGQETRVHHWSIAAAMRPGEAKTLPRISDDELDELLSRASCVVVPSFDEGLSLPVIEAVRAGVPVVASSIPSHRELIGQGASSFDPRSPRSLSRAIRRVRGKARIGARQARRLARHSHATLEAVVGKTILDHVRPAEVPEALPSRPSRGAGQKLSVGIATPWNPQRTGVADFSTTVFTELAQLVDLTVYTTLDAQVNFAASPHVRLEQRSVDEIFADPIAVQQRHDAFISVIGNSHYHLPFVQVLEHLDAHVVAHDTRMVEFYMALRGKGGVEHLMLSSVDPTAPHSIRPSLDDQIDDMRLLQNAGFWEISQRAHTLIAHSPSAAPIVSRETGKPVYVLPFANQRVPRKAVITPEDRSAAASRLGFDSFPPGTIHLGSFGYVDPRTKMTDVVVETAAWLQQWGYPVALHLIGAATEEVAASTMHQAHQSGLHHFQITGFLTDDEFRDWLLAVDLGIQLRVSPFLGVSGPLSDLAAFGTSAVASNGLCVDVDTPGYIQRLPDAVSPILVAEAVEDVLAHSIPADEREEMRINYLESKAPSHYARLLLDLIKETQ